MLKNILSFAVILFSLSTVSSQISFEKGYFINNIGERTDCLIRNVDWKNNPVSFDYRLSKTSETQVARIGNTKEFGIADGAKFKRVEVQMDRSSNLDGALEYSRAVVFNDEKLFLKVLVEGKANLYFYEEGNLRRFFYSKENDQIKQLVYKRYRLTSRKIEGNIEYQRFGRSTGVIAENTEYKQELLNNLTCADLSQGNFSNLRYRTSSMVDLFNKYNKCSDPNYSVVSGKGEKFILNISLRPGMNISSLKVSRYNTNFDSNLSLRFGLEFVVILPFNKNKWSIVFEPTYRTYKTEEYTSDYSALTSNPFKVDYSSIEFAVGIRHAMFLNNKSSIFISGYLLNDLELNDSFLNNPGKFVIDPLSNFAFGLGYRHGKKFSIEFRYDDSRELLRYTQTTSKFNNISIILGYTIL